MGAALHDSNGRMGLHRAWPSCHTKPSIRDVFPTDLVADEVEGSVEDGGDENEGHHGHTQFFRCENRRAEEKLAPQEHHDGEGEGVQ